MLGRNAPAMLDRDFDGVRTQLRVFLKDLGLIQEMARDLDTPSRAATSPTGCWEKPGSRGWETWIARPSCCPWRNRRASPSNAKTLRKVNTSRKWEISAMPDEKVAYFNGEMMPADQVGISIYDRGFLYGDAVFDATRTFGGKTFRLDRHIDRLYDSLRYLRIEVSMSKAEMTAARKQSLPKTIRCYRPARICGLCSASSRG